MSRVLRPSETLAALVTEWYDCPLDVIDHCIGQFVEDMFTFVRLPKSADHLYRVWDYVVYICDGRQFAINVHTGVTTNMGSGDSNSRMCNKEAIRVIYDRFGEDPRPHSYNAYIHVYRGGIVTQHGSSTWILDVIQDANRVQIRYCIVSGTDGEVVDSCDIPNAHIPSNRPWLDLTINTLIPFVTSDAVIVVVPYAY